MNINSFKRIKKSLAAILTLTLMITAVPESLAGLKLVKAADPAVTQTTKTYDFTSIDTSYRPAEGDMVSTTGIYFAKYVSSGVSFDGTLRFRNGNVLYFPINADTTKVTITMTCNGDKPDRLVILGEDKTDTTYNVAMATAGSTVTVDDITDYIKEIGGVKYIPLISNGDVKAKNIVIVEYNPINSVTVSGNIANAAANNVTKIKFKNLDNTNAPVVIADVDALGNYSAVLRRVAGNTQYVASISNPGFKIDNSGNANKFTLTGNAATATNNFTVVSAPVADLSGSVTGVADNMLKGELKVKLVPADTALDEVEIALTKTGDGTYTYSNVLITPEVAYDIVLTNADDYEVLGAVNKTQGVYSNVEIVATAKALNTVTGSFVTSDKNTASVTKITFTNMDTPDYTYTFDVSGNTYTANLRAGEYETSVVCDGYTAYDHVSVSGTSVNNEVYLQAPEDVTPVEYQPEIKVGQGEQFDTIASAVKYIARMQRDENDRVTILLMDALYREQLIIDTPNITIKSERNSGSTITWYYGVGYSYYSAKKTTDGKNGSYYDEACAVDKYYKAAVEQNPGHWGATVNLFAGAAGFKAENITFENSLNRYMTTEEVTDGVGTNVIGSLVDRSTATDADVLKKGNKERAAVLYIQADDTEYNNCKFLSSQDTIYTGDDNETSYFTDCVIEGTTDYICGDGNPVFDSCDLSMYGYSDQEAVGSYIVASKNKGTSGYLFNNCRIVTTDFPGLQPTSQNILARAWGAGIVTFLNTEVESSTMIDPVAYKDMNAKVEDAHYYEYNTHTPDGTVVDTSLRAEGVTILTKEQAEAIDITSYFGDFRPTYYYADYTQVDEVISAIEELNPEEYANFSVVEEALALIVRDKTRASQEEVDAMVKKLNDAIAALEKKTQDKSEEDAAKTSDTTNTAMYLLIMGMSGGVLYFSRKKRKLRVSN